MRTHNLLASSAEWAWNDTVTDEFLWEHRHVTDIDEFLAARKTEFLTSGWPFRSKPLAIVPIDEKDTLRFIAELAAGNQIGWDDAHRRAADYYIRQGDFIKAGKEYETILSQFPLDVADYIALAQAYCEKKEFFTAETILLASIRIRQTSIAYRTLGDIYLNQRKFEKAIQYYEALNKFPSDPGASPENAYMLAMAYLFSQKIDQATRTLEQAIDRYPSYKPARELLTKIKLHEKSRNAQ
jgi:tetratricopeptide (TPR) repeat protein